MQDIFLFTAKSKEEIFKQLDTSINGLTASEVSIKQIKYGLNEITSHKVYIWQILLRQLKSPFLYLLIIAAVLSIFLKGYIDSIMIFLFVLINTALGFYQEYKSEEILKSLKKYITPLSKVNRDGKSVVIESSQIVPGDIVLLESGDIIPADIRIIEETNLTCDESILTGESEFIKKTSNIQKHADGATYKLNNICFAGTTVISGKAVGIAVRTGKSSEFGKVSKLAIETHGESGFEKSIKKLSNFILKLITITLVLVFIANILLKGSSVDIPNLAIFSIALAVGVIPEALPIVMTFSMSKGAKKLAKNGVVVKRLSAIEDLGSIEILCTDKTGTLTEGVLTVVNVFPEKSRDVLFYAGLKSSVFGEAIKKTLTNEEKKEVLLANIICDDPFDPERKRDSLLIKGENSSEVVVRGAFESVSKFCTNITTSQSETINAFISSEGKMGRRVISVARKSVDIEKHTLESDEKDLKFLGLISFDDPIKKTAFDTIKKATSLGIKIKILSGDSKEVSGTVAQTVGLVDDSSKVVTGEEFGKLSDEKKHDCVYNFDVFARITPEQKYEIIQLLQKKHEVGFLGEGINDAPALKVSNVAIVVKGASNIAVESSDIVLLKKSLEVIINGVKDGRETFANTTKYIKTTLSSNFGNFYAVAIISLFVDFLPLLPLQILLLNLLSDFPMIAVAADSVEKSELKSPKSYNIKEIALLSTTLGITSSIFDFIFFFTFYRISVSALQSNWFIGSVLTELLLLFSIRTKKSIFKAERPAKFLVILTIVIFIVTIAIPYTLLGHTVFKFSSPTINQLLISITIVIAYFITTEAIKSFYYKISYRKYRV